MPGARAGKGDGMLRPLLHGVTAGAVGTTVLNAVTYLDMAVRDRPASSVPADTVERAADLADVPLTDSTDDDDDGEARAEGLGALLGFLTGCGVGAAYGLLRPRLLSGVPRSVAGVGIAAAATVVTVAPYTALGVSDPRSWKAADWAADIIPHLCYGWAVAATFDALHAGRRSAGPADRR